MKKRVVTPQLAKDIQNALESVKGYGSVEIFIQDSKITQITTKSIKKTNQDSPNPCPVINPAKNCPLLRS